MTESALEAGLGVEGDAVVLVTTDDGEDACGGSAGAEGEELALPARERTSTPVRLLKESLRPESLAEDSEGVGA